MATRATIHIYDKQTHRNIIQIYHHYDGYPEGLGEKLKQYLGNIDKNTNAYPGELHKHFNGVGCFAASLVAYLKDCPGNVYLEPTDDKHGDTEYHYTIYYKDQNNIRLAVEEVIQPYEKTMFERSREK